MRGTHDHTADGLPLLRLRRSPTYSVQIPVQGSKRHRWIDTGATTWWEAREVVRAKGIDRIAHLAKADTLTADAICVATCGRKVTCREIVDGWKQQALETMAPNSVKNYITDMEAFMSYAHSTTKTLASIPRSTLINFINYRGVKLSRRTFRLSVLRALYKYARAYNYVQLDLPSTIKIAVREMPVGLLETRNGLPFTAEEYDLLMTSPAVSPTWRAWVALSYWTGLRFIDCACLEWDSITPDFLIVWTKKRGKRVSLPLDDPLMGSGILRTVFAAIPKTDPVYCFPDAREGARSGFRHKYPTQFSYILRKLGIYFRSFHSLRHTAISRWAQLGISLEQIGRLVGHADQSTTKTYVHELGNG